MAASAPAAARLRRGFDRLVPSTPAGFARLCFGLVGVMWLNIASGALVRVTGSGLGCPDWPLCEGRPVPPLAGHAVIEFSNRLIALAGIALALFAYYAARRVSDRGGRALALAIGLGTLGQAPLGALTVLFDLHPVLVMTHFLVAIVVGGLAALLWARADVAAHGQDDAGGRPRWLPVLALVTCTLAFALIVSGALSTASGPHAGGEDIRRIGNLDDATYLHVRVATAWIVSITAFVWVLVFGPWRPSRARPLLVALVVLVPAQALIGEIQWRTQLPWGLVLAHVAVAAALWLATVALVARVRLAPASP